MINLGDISQEQAASIRQYFQDLDTKLAERRIHNHIPKHFTVHRLELFNSRSCVMMAVDQSTSGRFAYEKLKMVDPNDFDIRDVDVIAFEDPADLTMFLMTYEPRKSSR